MVASFLSRFGLSFGSKPYVERITTQYFGRALGTITGAKLGSYIAEGENSSILSDLSSNAVQQKWRGRHMQYHRSRLDEGELFKELGEWRTDQMYRFGEAMALLEPIRYEYGFFGSKATPEWLRHVTARWLGHNRKGQPLETLIALAEENGLGVAPVVDIVFSGDATIYRSKNAIDRFAGVDQWLREEAEAITAVAAQAGANARAELAAAVGRYGLHEKYYPMLIEMATASAKGPRTAANQALTGADRGSLNTALEAAFAEATPARRAKLVETIASTLGEEAKPLLAELREGEKAKSVLAAMDRVAGAVAAMPSAAAKERSPWQQDGRGGFVAMDGEWVAAPPREEAPPKAKIAREAYDLLIPVIEAYNERIREEAKKYAKVSHHWSRHNREIDPTAGIAKLRALAEGEHPVTIDYGGFPWLDSYLSKHENIERFLDHPSVNLRHLVRTAIGMGTHSIGYLLGEWASPPAMAIQRRLSEGSDMRLVADLWLENGGKSYIEDYLSSNYYMRTTQFAPEHWPLFLEHFHDLDEALGLVPQTRSTPLVAHRGLLVLQVFPKVPERYFARLMILSTEGAAQVRELARALLAGAEGIEDSIALQLDDGKQDIRAGAADWLAARGAKGHIPHIRKRLKKEKSDKARAAMITALERLGDDTSDFFDTDAMKKEAEKGLKKAMPKGLDWFPFDALPKLSWANGEPVDPVLPRYWVVLSTRLKEPGGNALVDLWLDRLAPGDAHKLGWMVLTSWIAQDTRTPTEEEANAHALENVDARLQNNRSWAKRNPQYAEYYTTDYDTVFAQIKREMSGTYLGSAADSKGMLALASRVEGAEAAPRIRAFLKNHGSRVSQAKALLDVLASIGSPATLQVLLSTADRLKQKSVQAHAGKLIEAIAEQRGWTPAELADRTVPTGGLDDDGLLELDCGPERTYTARLDEEDKLIVLNPVGKEVKTLPPARVDEEKPTVAAAKKALSAAKKEVKQVVTAQTERFREAMCMEREWAGQDWRDYVAAHPILGRLAARLVWLGLDEDGQVAASFRPLGDGTYTDAADEDVDAEGFAKVKLAHSTLLDAETIAAWQTHFTDYDVLPLFDQLGRSLPEVTEDMRKQRAITDREGYMIETFRLRSIASKLGYQRGEVIDGGAFMTYTRHMREAGLVGEIEFTGSYLPEENIPAALISLSFRKLLPSGKAGQPVDLGKVPEVLLAECWRDLYDIAEYGTGYDPEWQQKGQL